MLVTGVIRNYPKVLILIFDPDSKLVFHSEYYTDFTHCKMHSLVIYDTPT